MTLAIPRDGKSGEPSRIPTTRWKTPAATPALCAECCVPSALRTPPFKAYRCRRTLCLLGSSQSLPALQRRVEQWHRSLARAKDLSGITWAGVDLPDYTVERPDPNHKDRVVRWHFHQIVSGKELAAEGTAMRHCVFSYKSRCVSGSCSIWALTRTDEFHRTTRHLTIEVNQVGTIVQKRGLANRLPRPEKNHVVDLWARKMGLTNRDGG